MVFKRKGFCTNLVPADWSCSEFSGRSHTVSRANSTACGAQQDTSQTSSPLCSQQEGGMFPLPFFRCCVSRDEQSVSFQGPRKPHAKPA